MNICRYAKIIIVCFFLSSLNVVFASNNTADNIDHYIQTEMQRQKIPGLSIAIIRDGKIIKTKGYGLANVELNVPATSGTIYQSGSTGKQFTAALILLLAKQGKLQLSDKISHYFRETPPSWKNITIYHLLTHTSGIKEIESNELNYGMDYTDAQYLKTAESRPLDFLPGDQWKYSDTGYVLLGILINQLTGKFYGDLLDQTFFKPLGMKTTRIISDREIISERAAGYQLINGKLKNQNYVSPYFNSTADGSLYITVLDFAKWDEALNKHTLLTKSDLDLLWKPVKLNNGTTRPYGLGWMLTKIKGHDIVEHSGHWQGFSAFIMRDLNAKLTVILLANLADVDLRPMTYHVAGFTN